jgi:hypothetical protein
MAKYSVEMNRTASTSFSVGNITADATRPRRSKLYDITMGSEAAPADNVFLWTVQRCTTAGTATGVTPSPLDPADAATETDAAENHTGDPTYTSGAVMLSIPLNQRASYRWVAAPGGELVIPATAANGLGVRTLTSTAVAVTATIHFDEQ